MHSITPWVYMNIYIYIRGRTLAVLETLLSSRLDTEKSFPLMFSPPAACLSFIPDIWTTNRRLGRPALRGTLRDVALILKASVNTVLHRAPWTLSNGQSNPPFEGRVKGQRLNGNVGESRETDS